MSKLDDLINELCPNGVEYKKIGDVCEIGKGIQFNKENMLDVGTYPVINGGINPSGYIEQYNQKENTITISQGGASAGFVNWIKTKFWAGAHCYVLHPNENIVLNRYLFHFVKSKEFKLQECQYGAGIPALSKNTVSDIQIPVPPLEIQNEIVRILDNFTELTSELTSELTARKKQYEYYRDSLLTFDDSVEWKTLEELCTKVTDGSHFSPKATEKGYPMPSVKDMRFNSFDLSNCKKISEKDYTELVKTGCKPLLNDVLIAKDGSMLKYAFPIKEELDLVILSSIAILRPKTDLISPDYFAHYFRQDSFREIVIRDYSSKGGVPRIVLKNFKKIKIPVPTLEKQKQIVTILDRFETLCNDITSGLPAEIEARKKQYEYYRDKLLSFKKMEVYNNE